MSCHSLNLLRTISYNFCSRQSISITSVAVTNPSLQSKDSASFPPQQPISNSQPLALKYIVLRLCVKMIVASAIRYIRRANKKRQEKRDAEQAKADIIKVPLCMGRDNKPPHQGQSEQSYSNQGSVKYGQGQY